MKSLSNKMKKRVGKEANNSKLTEKDVLDIRFKYKNENISQTTLSKKYNVNQVTISRIVNRKNWTHI